MMAYSLYLFLLISINSMVRITSISTAAYTAAELILLSCGASTITNDTSHRSWDSDQGSKYVPSNAASLSSASDASTMEPWVSPVPYKTARVFHSPFTYTFPLTGGQKFLRLYFYPDVYSDVYIRQSFFSVKANAFTLFTNFRDLLYSINFKRPSFIMEFIVYIGPTQTLDLTFTPDPNSFAFVNGIEIVSIPDKLYLSEEDVPIKFENGLFYLNRNTALENIYRLNVGGAAVAIEEDSGLIRGMFRGWSPDDDYIFYFDYGYSLNKEELVINYTSHTPPYTAPPQVYISARTMTNISRSLEWVFTVDSGFHYLLRFHFCEFVRGIVANDRVFSININNQTADAEIDVIYLAGGPDIPITRDYITWVPDGGNRGKQDLWISLEPNLQKQPRYSAMLNGLEIFKLNELVTKLPLAPVAVNPPSKKHRVVIYTVVGSVIGVVVVAAAVMLLILRKVKDTGTSVTKSRSTAGTCGSAVSLTSDICRYFSLNDIKTATRNFDDNFVIGRGGFGNVYKGLIDNAATTVAIKRLNSTSSQGASEFLTEIDMLSKLRHRNLVSLIGYCDDKAEMILVYDYMAHGTLRDHIYNSDNPPLMWKQCLQICLGAAKGLDYLHSGTKHSIIHRDVKSTNILLDEKWVAKISDFGLSKMGQKTDSFTHISTNVKGTFGYLDPEYFSTCKLTRKADVYAFGVVLFEVLCRRGAVDMRIEEEKHSLAGWARRCIQEGKVEELIDQSLMGQISAACLEAFVGIGGRCLHLQPQERPAMADVVKGLELAMELQQDSHPTEQEEESENDETAEPTDHHNFRHSLEISGSVVCSDFII